MTDRAHVVTVVYDFQGRALHTCLECHYAGFSPPPLPCPGRALKSATGRSAMAADSDIVGVRICEVDDCSRPHRAKGLCATHWSRVKRTGRVELGGPQWASGPERLWAKVTKTKTCWLWTGVKNPEGYGSIRIEGKMWRVHRYVWMLLRGPIPDGMVLDHVCRVRHCVNPDHLEPVTGDENTYRGISYTAINRRKTHCNRGHEFTPENTYMPPGRPRERHCIECSRERVRQWRRRTKGARP